ncbi:hypothetical protein PF011_g19700 [Phytophthora fragariae]|uniref:Uncharacterized protein n=1 Tax=Phytophthora fragariae TaxID=53985 RepID=A0A6A3IVT8_9STRA|nr:hypothetical protein PF011_g19700 [Phytophthora fragariae]
MLRKSSRADSRKTIQTLEEEGEEEVEDDVDGVENQSPQRQLQPPNTTTSNSDTMTVTVVQPVNNVRPHLRLTRRSSSAVERVTLQPPPEEKKNGGDKSLRPRFLQERSATIVHIQPSVTDPSRVPRSKASAFLLGVLAKSKTLAGPGLGEGKRGALEPLRAGVTNTVHYVPSQGAERGIPLRLAGRRNSCHLGRQLSIVSTTDLLEKAVPDGARKRRVSACQEQMAAVLRALQASKQQASQQLDILHSILRFINSNDRDDNGQRPVVKEMVDVGFIPELSSILREFRFNTDVQVCAMSILAAVAEESSVYAYMMSEFSLEKLLQKNATVHGTHEHLVLLASNLVHIIEDSKLSVNIQAYQADKAARLRRQSATYTDMIVAAIGASKPKQSAASPSPSRKCSTARRSYQPEIPETEVAQIRAMLTSAPPSEKSGSERDLGRSLGRQRQSFALPVDPPKLSANYRLLIAPELKKSIVQPLQVAENEVEPGGHQERRGRPSSSPSRKSLPLDLTSRSLATAIYSGGSIFVEPSPLSKRLPRQGSFSAGGFRKKLCAPKRVQRAQTEKLLRTQPLSLRPTESPTLLQNSDLGPKSSLIADNTCTISAARSAQNAELNDETTEVAGEKVDEEKGEEEENKTEEKEEDEEESYEDDFDGDDESEGKMMPSRSDNATIASDGELFGMLHDISAQDLGSAATPIEIRAATIIQRRIRGTLARKAYPRPRRSSSSENITQASEKKTPRTISTGKSTKRNLHPEGTKRKQIPLSARAPRQLQTEASSRRGNSLRSIPQAASRTTSSRLITPGKEASKTKVPSAGAGVRHPSLATNSHLLSSSRSLRSMGHSAFRLFSSNSSHDIDTGSTEVAKEPPDPESLKQIQALYAEGLQHQKENHLGLAIECYEKALAIPGGQSFASIHVNIGSALMAKNKFSEALESFRQAKRIQPDNTKAIYNYSLALLHLDRPQEAQQLLRRILELDPNHEKAAIALSHIQGAIL